MTLLVGNNALSGGTSYVTSGRVSFNTAPIAAVLSGTGTHIVIPNITSTGTVSSARAAVFDDAGNLLAATAEFTPTTGENRVALASSVAITATDEYYIGVAVSTGELLMAGGTATWAVAYRTATFPAIPDPVLPATDWTNFPLPNIYVDGTTGSSAATLSNPTPSGTLETETTATAGCTTDTEEGDLYVVLSLTNNVSGASGAQIKAGQNSGSTSADFAGDAAVTGASPSVEFTGLAEDTLHYYAMVQETEEGFSNVLSGTFTTAATPSVLISGISDSTLTNGQAGIVITGTGFSASGNTVLVSPTDDPNDGDAVAQTITAEGATEITFTAVLGALSFGTLYLFVVNDDEQANVDGEVISRIVGLATLQFTGDNRFVGSNGQPAANIEDLTFLIWRSARPTGGTADQIISGQNLDANGGLSLPITPGALTPSSTVYWNVFAPDGTDLFGAGESLPLYG